MNITIWNESVNRDNKRVKKVYPDGMSEAIKEIFDNDKSVTVSKVYIDMACQGLSDNLLNSTDVLIWWGHSQHELVEDTLVDKICKRVEEGMGIIFLHSAHFSKPFKKLMGTSCSLQWREAKEAERLWTANPSHPIATGVEQGFRLNKEEMYGEHFDIPDPDDVIFLGWFKGGNVFRSGVTFTRGKGRIFYFQCGHETFPIYYNKNVRKIIYNAALWVAGKDIVNNFKANTECVHARIAKERLF